MHVIHDLSVEIRDGEFLVFVGPSGCGKSTLLRMIAGLESFDQGQIFINEKLVNDLHPSKRDIAMVFQDYALYPHMSVRKNMGFGLKMRGFDSQEVEKSIHKAASILQIEHLLERKPKELSGGKDNESQWGVQLSEILKYFCLMNRFLILTQNFGLICVLKLKPYIKDLKQPLFT